MHSVINSHYNYIKHKGFDGLIKRSMVYIFKKIYNLVLNLLKISVKVRWLLLKQMLSSYLNTFVNLIICKLVHKDE
jgi:hypothetical protein